MHTHDDTLRKQLSRRPCSVCHTSGEPASFLVLAKRKSSWLVLVICSKCHHRAIYLAHFSQKEKHPNSQFPIPISNADVISMRNFLSAFNGDFVSLFKCDGGFPID